MAETGFKGKWLGKNRLAQQGGRPLLSPTVRLDRRLSVCKKLIDEDDSESMLQEAIKMQAEHYGLFVEELKQRRVNPLDPESISMIRCIEEFCQVVEEDYGVEAVA